LILRAFGTAAICFAVPHLVLGETVTVRSAYRAVNPKAIRLIWVFLMQALFSFWPFFFVSLLVLALPLQTVFPGSMASLIVYGSFILLGLVPSLALFLRYSLAQSACMIEDIRVFASIERSVSLSRGNRWPICVAVLVLFLPYGLLIWGCDSGVDRLIAVAPLLTGSHAAAHAIRQLPEFVLNLVWTPILYIVFTLLYLKLVEQKDKVSLPGLLNGALAAKRPKPYYDEGPAPWGEDAEILTGVEESSVSIPWSMFGAGDAALQGDWEAAVRKGAHTGPEPNEGDHLTADPDPAPSASAEPREPGKNPESTEPPQADPGESR
jgi:hypothetical protein